MQAGLAALSDISIGESFNALIGVCYDYVDAEGDPVMESKPEVLGLFVSALFASLMQMSQIQALLGLHLSYKLPGNITPYFTTEQSTIISGAAADISTSNIAGKHFSAILN